MEMFIKAIPYNFYSLLTFLFIILTSFLCVDFGPMLKHERNAVNNNDLFSGSAETEETIKPIENARGRVVDIVTLIVMLIVVCTCALAYNGGILEGKSLVDAFGDTDATVALPWGGLVVLVFTVFYLAIRRVMSPRKTMDCVVNGFGTMVPPILILTLATSLKNMTNLLNAKEYVADIMTSAAPSLQNFMPAVIFFVACILAFSTGTSWGTFGILIPIVVNIFPVGNPLLFIGMSACLAGAVCGDHCSPISDTTIMSAAGARCELISHVTTQLPYAVTVAVISFIGFVIAGWTRNWFISFFASAVIMVITIAVLKFKGYSAFQKEARA
jgi:Na+/H+ antiporter NhaC